MIKKCKCASPYQDQKYGAGNRVWNPTTKGRRCSVCDATVIDDTSKEVNKKDKRKK